MKKEINPLFYIALGIVFLILVSLGIENFCDNSSLPLWLQGVFAIPCFPLFQFGAFIVGVALIWMGIEEMRNQ